MYQVMISLYRFEYEQNIRYGTVCENFELWNKYLYRCTAHFVVYLINTPTNAHI